MGPVAAQLLACIQAIHDLKHIVIDVKPENFMLAPSRSKDVASRIRLLDLALVQPWVSIDKHRPNQGSTMAGTPMYASLNLHKGETPSRRDDLEALGYVIAEIIMQITHGCVSQNLLPWSQGKSDESIGQLKQSQVDDPNSDFYKRMGGSITTQVFRRYMDEVRGYGYKKNPDYEFD